MAGAEALKRATGKDIVSGTGLMKTPEWLPYTRRFAGKPDVFNINDNFDCFRIGGMYPTGLAFLGARAGSDHPFAWMCHDMLKNPHSDPWMALLLPGPSYKSSPAGLAPCRLFPDRQIAYFRTGFTDPKGTAAAFEVRGPKATGEHAQWISTIS